MRRSRKLAILLVLGVSLLAGLARAQNADLRPPQGLQFYPAARPVGDVRFLDANGRTVHLSDFKGRLVLLNVWATWCPGCRLEMPSLDRAQENLNAAGLTVIAVSLDKKGLALAAPFFRESNIKNLPIFLDPQWELRKAFGIEGLPATILISRDGWELGRAEGRQDWSAPTMRVFLENLLQRP